MEYILPLVYYKSISNELEKEYAENAVEYGEDFARWNNLYNIPVVPEGYLWEDVLAWWRTVESVILSDWFSTRINLFAWSGVNFVVY